MITYELKINGMKQPLQLGAITERKFEEALDGGKLLLKLEDVKDPLDQYSFVEFNIKQKGNKSKKYEFLVISDEVPEVTKYGLYEHDLTVIEYSAKLDAYLTSFFAFSKDMLEKKDAPYELIANLNEESNVQNNTSSEINGTPYKLYFHNKNHVKLPKIIETVYGELKVDKVPRAKYYYRTGPGNDDILAHADVFIEANTKQGFKRIILSDEDAYLDLLLGKQEIKIGFMAFQGISGFNQPFDYYVYKIYVDVREETDDSLYQVIMNLRDVLSKFGGVESKKYFDETRLFNLSNDNIKYLKEIKAPQIYIPSATARQQLMFIFSYVNAVPRLVRGETIDELQLEFFGETKGSFTRKNITESYSEQNINQIGTKTFADIKNILPNDLENPSTYAPYQSGFQTVRSTNVEMTDSTFELKLPKDKPLYKPVSFRVEIPYSRKQSLNSNNTQWQDLESGNIILDLTSLLITKNEWDLKRLSTNFPSVYYSKAYSQQIGLADYKLENMYWQEGDTSIKFNQVSGEIFRKTLLESVIKYAFNKYLTEQDYVPDTFKLFVQSFETTLFDDSKDWYKDVKFIFEYITNENMLIKQDKEDLSQIKFYSEIRHNQDENTVSLPRTSMKMYGDLQRTGNKSNSFTKYHTNLDDMYEVGMTDTDDNTIVSIKNQYFNEYIKSTYTTIKHYNRISQATFIDQTYRWRDNYASDLKTRQDHYDDYVMLIPSDMNYDEYGYQLLYDEHTKITERVSSETNRQYLYSILFGLLGVKHDFQNTKATLGLVRTDGMLSVEGQKDDNDKYSFITTPLTSAGFKGGLNFKLSFGDSQVAGDKLVKEGINYYNRPVIYTGNDARFKYLDFYILNQLTDLSGVLVDREELPLIKANKNQAQSLINNNKLATFDNLLYFGTGNLLEGKTADDSIIINKDPMSDFSLNYQLKVMSYYYGVFIIGRSFFFRNNLVDNRFINKDTYLYRYTNNTRYNIFDDIQVKDGYSDKILLEDGDVNITYLDNMARLSVNYLASDLITGWAIGDEFGNLYLASNTNVSEVDIVKTHFRPNVMEIGEVELPILKINVRNENEYYTNINSFKIPDLIIDDIENLNYYDDVISATKVPEIIITGLYNENHYTISYEALKAPELVINQILNENLYELSYNQEVKPSIEFDINNIDYYITSQNIKKRLDLSLNIYNENYYSMEDKVSKRENIDLEINNQLLYSDKITYNIEAGQVVEFGRPRVALSKETSGSNVVFNAIINNDNNTNYEVEYEVDLSGNIINGGIVYSNYYRNINSFKTISASTSAVINFRARFKNSYGQVTAWTSTSITHTQTTSGRWEYKGKSSFPFCSDPGYNMIGTTCQVIGETTVVSGSSIGMSSTCVELICK